MRTLLLTAMLMLPRLAWAQTPPAKPYNPCLAAGVRETVVFLGAIQTAPGDKEAKLAFFGTGFLLEVDRLVYLLTARHVVQDYVEQFKGDKGMVAAVNLKSGPRVLQSLEDVRNRFKVGWVVDESHDLGVMPFAINRDWDVRTLPESAFLPRESLAESQNVFFISFHPGLAGDTRITPIQRRGMVSLVTDTAVYLDAFVFPGNSGSPVFTQPAPISFGPGSIELGGDPLGCKLVGIVTSYLPYQEVAVSLQTKRPRVIFEENSGLARLATAADVAALLASDEFRKQHQRLLSVEAKR